MKNSRVEKSGTRSKTAQVTRSTAVVNLDQAQPDFSPGFATSNDVRRVMAAPQTLNAASILRLQQTVGNRSVQRILQARKPQTSSASVVQRAGGKGAFPTYVVETGQSWKDIATLHGIDTTAVTGKWQSFLHINSIEIGNVNDKPPVGSSIKLPRTITPKPPTTTTTTTGTTGVTGGTGTTGGTGATAVTVPDQAELGYVFAAIGKFLDFMVQKPGDKYSFEFGFRVPVYGGVFVGMKLSGEAELDNGDGPSGKVLKLDAKLGIEGKSSYSFLYYGQVDFSSSLVRNLKAESNRGGSGAMEALSFGLYRNLQENSYIPGRIMNWIWGSDREGWSSRTAGRMAGADDKAFVGTALGLGVGGTVGGTKAEGDTPGSEPWKAGVEMVGSVGTEYNKDSIEKGEQDSGGGFSGKKGKSWFGGGTEASLGETKTVMEFAAKTEILGTEVGIKVAREGGEWGMELGLSYPLIANLSGVEWSDKMNSLYGYLSSYNNALGTKFPELVRMFGKTAGFTKSVMRSGTQLGGYINSLLPAKETINSVLAPIFDKASSLSEPVTSGLKSGWDKTEGFAYGDLPHTSIEEGSEGFNIDREGKTDAEAKLNGTFKLNLTKREVEFGLDLVGEAGFDSSAITAKGARSKRIFKVKKP